MLSAFEYAIVRVVPRVEREEFINAGVMVFCHALDFLEARIELDRERLAALDPEVDADLVERHLSTIPRICGGGTNAGPIGALPVIERWRWLVAPRSSIVQISPAHAGLCDSPQRWLERLLERVVRR